MISLMAACLTCVAIALAKGQGLPLTGAILLLLAAAAGLMSAFGTRRHTAELVEQIRKSIGGHELRRINAPSKDQIDITDAINDLLASAGKVVSDASIKVKELEIQLKVATAERQHAEAIIYSISDAVLVTDPFDDLVLANESAARTFEFDLARAGRAPVEQVLKDEKVIGLIREMRQSNSAQGRRI